MEILVYLDDEDLNSISQLVEICNTKTPKECNDAKDRFWCDLIDKYPVLKNRKVALNARDKIVISWNNSKDLKYTSLG